VLRTLSVWILALSLAGAAAAQTGGIRGAVMDETGAVIPGATVTATGPGGSRTVTSGDDGTYAFQGLAAGEWTVVATSPGLRQLQPVKVKVGEGVQAAANLTLSVVLENQQVTVKETEGPAVSVNPEANAGALVMTGDDLKALSDDPDELQQDLQALAGPSAGPDGGQIFIDGFTGGQLPPKESIREIRINQNPFSAEYDKLGYGRIEIFTKPGTDKWHGQGFFNYSDIAFDARNPYSSTKPFFMSQQFGGNVSGSLNSKTSIFLDAERRNIDDDGIVDAITLGPNFQPEPLNTALGMPMRRTEFSPRIDYQASTNNTIMFRYSYTRNDLQNQGVGGLSLPETAYASLFDENKVQVTDTYVVNAKTINETRFQYVHDLTNLNPASTAPEIQVNGAFFSGGATQGLGSDLENLWEMQNYTSYSSGTHMVKFGVRVRGNTDDNVSRNNFNGTFIFNSIQSYQQMAEMLAAGEPFSQIYNSCTDPSRLLCPGPSQLRLTAGIPATSVGYVDVEPFVQDDWKLRPNLTLSLGLRYEMQNTIGDYNDWAPRLGFAWAPGGGKSGVQPKLVFRGGFGMFYTRFPLMDTLMAERLNGITQRQYLINYPDFYPAIPPLSQLPAAAAANISTIANNIRAPYIMQSAVSAERQLPLRSTLSVTFMDSRGEHLLMQRDINAPLPGTYIAGDPASGVYPYGGINQINQYESAGIFRQQQVIVSFRSQVNSAISLFGGYFWNNAHSNYDAQTGFPSSSYNLAQDYSRSSLDIGNRVMMMGSITLKGNIRFNPFLMYHSGQPFNIVIGQDINGDGHFTDRPSFATASTPAAEIVSTPYGVFNINPGPFTQQIPRNLGTGPGYFSLNFRVAKTWGFGGEPAGSTGMRGGGGPGPGGPGPFGGGRGPRGGPGGRGGMFDTSTGQRFNLTLAVMARNLLNNVNPGLPIGTLTSPLFGESNSSATGFGAVNALNRRIELQLRFAF
jgi:hypothetical protein